MQDNSMALSDTSPNERKRVKVYELRDNDWHDRGTGFCAVQTINDDGRIYVEAEEEPDMSLLEVRIKKDDNYQKQQETLIVWTDSDGIDMALSFQEAEGCGMVWDTIGEVQHRLPDGPDDRFFPPMILPTPDLPHLAEIESIVRGASNTQQGRDALTKLMLNENYIAGLIPLVQKAEEREDLQNLHRLSNIMKTLILFNETSIIEYVVRDEIITGVVGALEYDPDFPNHKANHRQYLSDESKFKEVVRIENEDVQRKIHFTYRLQYLKDVVLARILDDPTFSVLNSLIYFHQIEIVQHITMNKLFLEELFTLVSSPETDPEKRKDAVLFIQQSCSIAKTLQASSRGQLYTNFISCGLFSIITYALQHQDAAVRVAGTDILVAVIEHDALMMRQYIYKSINDKSKPMTDTLIELLLVETDLGVKAQIADAIKVLLEPSSNAQGPDRSPAGDNLFLGRTKDHSGNPSNSESFLQTFFDQSAKKLFQPLKDLENRKSPEFTVHENSLYFHLVEILCFFLRQPSARTKYFIISEGLSCRIVQLISSPQKHLKLTAIKYFRTCITSHDEYYIRQMVTNNLFEPLLNIIYETMPRDNLLNSACLELFDFIRRESIKSIIVHLVESYRERLESMTFVDIFSGIILRYEQYRNPNLIAEAQGSLPGDVATEPNSSFMTSDGELAYAAPQRVMINGGGTRWQGLKGPDAEEDAYFNTSDDDEDDEDDEDDDDEDTSLLNHNPNLPLAHQTRLATAHVSSNGITSIPTLGSTTKPLVDYDDDDDSESDDIAAGQAPMNFAQQILTPTSSTTSSAAASPSTSTDAGQMLTPATSEESIDANASPTSSNTMLPAISSTNNVSSSSSSSSPSASPLVNTNSIEPPKTSLAEKRRREEDDDDDELGKLSTKSNPKRRNSGAGPITVKQEQPDSEKKTLKKDSNDEENAPPRSHMFRQRSGAVSHPAAAAKSGPDKSSLSSRDISVASVGAQGLEAGSTVSANAAISGTTKGTKDRGTGPAKKKIAISLGPSSATTALASIAGQNTIADDKGCGGSIDASAVNSDVGGSENEESSVNAVTKSGEASDKEKG